MGRHRILFLYTELAGYFLSCVDELGESDWVEAVKIVHWPIHDEAPFEFGKKNAYSLLNKETLQGNELHDAVHQFQPTAIVCSGWIDSDYLKVARAWKKNIPVVVAFDNWWTGSWKQWGASAMAPFTIQRTFNRAWVAGAPQIPLANKLGFSGKRLSVGVYCADPSPFLEVCRQRQQMDPVKKLVYVGRYLKLKGVADLWHDFAMLSPQHPEWELHCIGTGELWGRRERHPKIIHHGFVQPRDMAPHLANAAAVVIPSHKEPWGVVAHEMAIAGLPLLASSSVGAASEFVEHGENGFIFENGEMLNTMRSFLDSTDEVRARMGAKSHQIGMRYQPKHWVSRLRQILNG